jgi:alpha-N-arabinofuranosidase
MLLHTLALLAALTPQLQNGDFDSRLAGWTPHHHGNAGPEAVIHVEDAPASGLRHALVIESRGSRRAGVAQTVYLPPGSLWRLSARTCSADGNAPRALIEAATPSGVIGSSTPAAADPPWSRHEVVLRAPSPGEVAIHLDSLDDRPEPVNGRISFADVWLEPVSEPEPGQIRIHLRPAGKQPVDPKQQGQFIELLCRLIPSMLAQQVDNDSFEEEAPYRFAYVKETDHPYRPWYPDGAVQVADYSLDTQDPYNGQRSQEITIHLPHARAGIAQDGFYLQSGLRYRLRLHLKGTASAVRAVLRDSQGLVARPAELGHATTGWQPAEAVLTASRNSSCATLALDFEGAGTLWLDRVYLIGEDAVQGLWRPDVVAALRDLKPGVIRFGGSATEGFEWDRAIGNWDARSPFPTVWGGLEPNFVGIEEFVELCRLVGAEPLICVRWTGKQPADAAAEVEYMNGAPQTHWGGLRARNGHRQPYAVKYWQIGNEVGGEQYAHSIAAFAHAMRAADPSIKLLSSYPQPDLLERAAGQLDYLCPHHYAFGDLTEVARDFDSLRQQIAQHAAGRDVRVAVTEWNTTGGNSGLKRGMLQSLGNALDCSRYHNLLHRYADLVEIGIRSNLIDSFGSGVFVTGPGWIYRAPTYYAEQLYSRAAGSYPLQVERDAALPWQLQQPDVSATLSADGRLLRIYAVNSTPQKMTPAFAFVDSTAHASGATAFVLKNRHGTPTTEALNSASDRLAVSINSKSLPASGNRLPVSLDPYSLTLLEVRLVH